MAGGTTTAFVPANDEPWPNSVTQRGIVAAVADRGYLEGYTIDQRIARQLVKLFEELCEALQAVNADDTDLHLFIQHANSQGKWARAIFDVPSLFSDVMVDVPTLLDELPDLVVPLAVLADAVGMDMMLAGLEKAQADVARGVRNGTTTQAG
jgi:NTP pyrophosphatase (non-canonical NTP hydrolase)